MLTLTITDVDNYDYASDQWFVGILHMREHDYPMSEIVIKREEMVQGISISMLS